MLRACHSAATGGLRGGGVLRNASVIASRSSRLFPASKNASVSLAGGSVQVRSFWWGDKKDGGDGSGEDGDHPVVVDRGSRGGALTSLGVGDEAPKYPHLIGVPVSRRPLFPGLIQAVNITDEKVAEGLVKMREAGHSYVGIFLRNKDVPESTSPELITDPDQIYRIGTFAQVHNLVQSAIGTQLLLMGHRRIAIEEFKDLGPPLRLKVRHWPKLTWDTDSESIRATCNEVLSTMRDILKLNPLAQEHLQFFVNRVDVRDPFKLADFAASLTTADGHELQKVLESNDAEERLMLVLEILKKERQLAKLQQEISQRVEERISKQQREYFLMEQLKSIKKELGLEKDDKEALLTKYQERINKFQDVLKPDVKKAIDEEMQKLTALEKNSPEFNVTRSYLDWLTQMPWGKFTEDNLDVLTAKQVLDEDHYGLKDIKNRILEFIAVSKLKGSVHGKILCFVGPPGVGKTSIGKSIARALHREFYRFSVGGLTDVAEIKGHRRTYIGAMPGKVIQCLKTTQTSNPLVLIDEIDKLGRGYQGDPASALLELLDPNQNNAFVDHYLDVPVDLSGVLFICTANVEDTIPGPLHDRMEIIRLSGYDVPEKVAIAEQYLIPKSMSETGLTEAAAEGKVRIEHSAIDSLVRWYCRESGVRNLEKHIERICRKLAFQLVKSDTLMPTDSEDVDLVVTDENLHKFVGKQRFTRDRLYQDELPAGVVMGLAWTSMGGSSLYIETVALPREKGGNIQFTGQLGNVMQESTRIAHTFAKTFLHKTDPENKFFDTNDLHLHVPEGATPKDGPSAGITMVTSMLSLATGRACRKDLAMTGEVSLTGKVLAVGGIKEKTIAARRSGVSTLILPADNRRDYDELPDYLKEGLTVHFATSYDDVFAVAFE